MMIFLAWYTVILIALGVVGNVVSDSKKGRARLIDILSLIPILIFALLYVL